MDDFLTYFLAGMLGEELLRKIATRPFGFWVLWLIGFLFVNILLFLLLFFLAFLSFLKAGIQPEESLFSIIREGLSFFFVTIQPWATLVALGGGILLAISYRSHYLDKHSDTQK